MTIAKLYKTMKQAERYQTSLYNKYFYVRLVEFPRFTESGIYKWEVSVTNPQEKPN